jgi:catalase (peroxidase I)
MAPAPSNTDADYDVVVIGSGVGGYPCADSKKKFGSDFAAAWTKVINTDRFEAA